MKKIFQENDSWEFLWHLKKREPRKKIARKRLALVGLNFGKQLLTLQRIKYYAFLSI